MLQFTTRANICLAKRYFSNGPNQKMINALEKILHNVKKTQTSTIQQIPDIKERTTPKPLSHRQKPLLIPTKLDRYPQHKPYKEDKGTETALSAEEDVAHVLPTKQTVHPNRMVPMHAVEDKPPQKSDIKIPTFEYKEQQTDKTMRPFEYEQEKHDIKIRPFEFERSSEPPDKKAKMKEKYKQMAMDINSKAMKPALNNDITFDNDISAWIYNEILKYNGERLPLPQDIVIEFPSISIEKAKLIRNKLIDDLIEPTDADQYKPMGDNFSSFNPMETNAARDPFDFTLYSKSKFDGIQSFDSDFHENGVNLSGLNAQSWFGYNNGAYSSYFNAHEPLIDEIESEYGKFRALVTKHNTPLSIEMILDLKRKISKIDHDSSTISFGITSANRREYIGNMDSDRMLSAYNAGIVDIGCLYFANLFGLIDDMMHLKKPLIMASSGQLSRIQNGLYLTGSARCADASMRMVFNDTLYGQIPCGGFYYFMHNVANKGMEKEILWSILSHSEISCWSLYELGAVDWMMPSPNHLLYLNHIGNEIDKTFNHNFATQDAFRHRAMIKNIIQLFDRGTEHYKADNIDALEHILSGDSLKKVMERIDKISVGDIDLNFDHFDDDMCADMIARANAAKYSINRSSPLAVYLSYVMYYGTKKYLQSTQEHNASNIFRTLLKYEYNAMCWLMHFGDFWEGIKYQNDNNYNPKWKWSSIQQLLNSQAINHLLPMNADSLENCIIFNELPCSWMKPLQFNDINDEANMSITAKYDMKKKNSNEYYLSDLMHLRGTVAPDAHLKLNKEYTQYRTR